MVSLFSISLFPSSFSEDRMACKLLRRISYACSVPSTLSRKCRVQVRQHGPLLRRRTRGSKRKAVVPARHERQTRQATRKSTVNTKTRKSSALLLLLDEHRHTTSTVRVLNNNSNHVSWSSSDDHRFTVVRQANQLVSAGRDCRSRGPTRWGRKRRCASEETTT